MQTAATLRGVPQAEHSSPAPVLWIVGQFSERTAAGNVAWQFQGVFDTEQGAIGACRDRTDFIAPVRVNEAAPDEATEWPGARHPLAGEVQP